MQLDDIISRNEAWKRRKAAASRGPWGIDKDGEIFPLDDAGLEVIEEEVAVVVSGGELGAADGALILAARNETPEADIDWLVARVRELEAAAQSRFAELSAQNAAFMDETQERIRRARMR